MIEQRRTPLHVVVTVSASRHLSAALELPCVWIFVALFALRGRSGEINIHQFAFEIRRAMAPCALHRAMRARQYELRCAVVEAFQITPGFCRVAHFTPERLAVRIGLGHPHCKLVPMRVGMACRTGSATEVINDCCRIRCRLVTLVACDRHVPARKNETSLLVLRQRKRGWRERGLRVTLFASVEVRRPGELISVRVLMAIRACREPDFEQRGASRWSVAFGAGHRGMFFAQRKACFIVFSEGELRLLETVNGVARFALAAVSPLCELPIVRIWLMAVGTRLKCNRRFEVRFAMTGLA